MAKTETPDVLVCTNGVASDTWSVATNEKLYANDPRVAEMRRAGHGRWLVGVDMPESARPDPREGREPRPGTVRAMRRFDAVGPGVADDEPGVQVTTAGGRGRVAFFTSVRVGDVYPRDSFVARTYSQHFTEA